MFVFEETCCTIENVGIETIDLNVVININLSSKDPFK
jgi:hypothetical protein